MPHSTIPRKTAPGAQDAQRAEERMHSEFALSGDQGIGAAQWAIHEAMDATKRAWQSVTHGDLTSGINALNRAGRALSAASDSLQGLMH